MPPAGRAPPCTRWGASRPPDPGITADAKGFRIQLALDTEPFCVRRLVFVGSPPFEVTVTRSIFVINTKNPRMRCRETFNKPRHAASPQPSSAPLTKVFEEEGGGLEGGGEPFSRRVPLPPPISHNNLLPERHAHVAVDEHVRLHVLADGLRRGGGKLREDFVGIAL